MHKYFKHYMKSIIVLGLIPIVYSILKVSHMRLDMALYEYLIFAIITTISAFFVLNYSKDKSLSLYSTFIIVTSWYVPIQVLLLIILISDVLYKIKVKFIDSEVDKIFSVKFIFNSMTKVIIIGFLYLLKLIVVADIYYIILGTLIYVIINSILITWVIRLYTNDIKAKVMTIKMYISDAIYIFITTTLLIYAFKAYDYVGLIFVTVFLMSFIGYILKPVTHSEMMDQISHDALTGLKSRGLFDKVMFDKIYEKVPFTLVFIDFDKFKLINDTYGHNIGDNVLIEFSKKAKESFYLVEKLYRFGGDEFCIIVDNGDDLELVLYSLRSLYHNAYYDDGIHKIEYSITIGSYTFNGEDTNVSDIIAAVSLDMKTNKLKS